MSMFTGFVIVDFDSFKKQRKSKATVQYDIRVCSRYFAHLLFWGILILSPYDIYFGLDRRPSAWKQSLSAQERLHILFKD